MPQPYITGLHHISLKPEGSEAFEKTLAFYRDVLCLEVQRQYKRGEHDAAFLKTGDALIEIVSDGKEPKGENGAINHIALTTTQVDELTERVRAAGYPVTTEPTDAVGGKIRLSFFKGPIGELVELYHVRG